MLRTGGRWKRFHLLHLSWFLWTFKFFANERRIFETADAIESKKELLTRRPRCKLQTVVGFIHSGRYICPGTSIFSRRNFGHLTRSTPPSATQLLGNDSAVKELLFCQKTPRSKKVSGSLNAHASPLAFFLEIMQFCII